MKVLFDTNIILDVLLIRNPFFALSANLLDAVESKDIDGFLCATTLTTIDYLVTKFQNKSVAKLAISKLLSLYSIAEVNQSVLNFANTSNFSDFEDAVLYFSALNVGVDSIVTRNNNDFTSANLPVYTPNQLWDLIN